MAVSVSTRPRMRRCASKSSSGATARACANISSTSARLSLIAVISHALRNDASARSVLRAAASVFKRTPQRHERAEMVRVVVCDEQRLAQHGLPLAVRDGRVQIRRRVFDQRFKRAQVFAETFAALTPILLARLHAPVRPIA